jgi:hypothetical protein
MNLSIEHKECFLYFYLEDSAKICTFAYLLWQRNPVRVWSCPATVSPEGDKSEYLSQRCRDKQKVREDVIITL